MFNLRDLGGHEAAGGRVRSGVLFRSNALVGLDDDERDALARLGLQTAVDLREPGERDAEPVDLDRAVGRVRQLAVLEFRPDPTIPVELREFNYWVLANRAPRLAAAVGLLSRDEVLPAVYFCSTGKDRTGILSALILSALGVGDEDVALDYARTEELIPAWYHAKARERARAMGFEGEWPSEAMGAPAPLMREVINWLRSEHGGAAEFLLANGLTEDELSSLRSRMMEPQPRVLRLVR